MQPVMIDNEWAVVIYGGEWDGVYLRTHICPMCDEKLPAHDTEDEKTHPTEKVLIKDVD